MKRKQPISTDSSSDKDVPGLSGEGNTILNILTERIKIMLSERCDEVVREIPQKIDEKNKALYHLQSEVGALNSRIGTLRISLRPMSLARGGVTSYCRAKTYPPRRSVLSWLQAFVRLCEARLNVNYRQLTSFVPTE